MNNFDSQTFSNEAAGTFGPFPLEGGNYAISAVATWGSLQFNMIGPDGSTAIAVGAAITANGLVTHQLPPGEYEFVATGGSAYYVAIVRIPA